MVVSGRIAQRVAALMAVTGILARAGAALRAEKVLGMWQTGTPALGDFRKRTFGGGGSRLTDVR